METYVSGGGNDEKFIQQELANSHNNIAVTIEMETNLSTQDETKHRSYINPNVAEDDEDSGWDDSDNDVDDDDDAISSNKQNIGARILVGFVEKTQTAARSVAGRFQKVTRGYFIKIVCILLYLVYFVTALCYRSSDEGAHRLIACTVLMSLILFRFYIFALFGWLRRKVMGSMELSPFWRKSLKLLRPTVRWALYILLAVVTLWTLINEGMDKPSNLRSLPGLLIFVLISLFTSKKPSKINWHTIYWSIGLQFLFALIALKWEFGKDSIFWVQRRLDEFFGNSKVGSRLLFGESYTDHRLVFEALPLFIFTNATIAILYYVGVMQFIIRNIGNFLEFVLETSPIESVSVAGGIFLEGIASVAALVPYLKTATRSQLFLIMTSSYASLGGGYMSLIASFQVPLDALIAAMVISAPATFTVSKLMMPETQKVTVYQNLEIDDEGKKKYSSILDALQSGATVMLGVVGNVAANAFTFWSFISWINSTLTWLGDRVGIDNLTLEEISSYVFYPVSLAMGVEPDDCRTVGMLMGYRVSSTNLIAYLKMVELKVNRIMYNHYQLATNFTGPISHHKRDIILEGWNKTLKDGFISERSEYIATYSLAGFSSMVSAAIIMAMLCMILPKRKAWAAKITAKALLAGNIANCMTGCFASLFH